MYERNAIVLERYLSKIFGQNNECNIKACYEIYKDILEETEQYQVITKEEEEIIGEFDEIAKKMQTIQKKQEVLCSEDMEHEEERNKLFNDFDQSPEVIEKKLLKIEKLIDNNTLEQKQIREQYIELLKQFIEKQQERNKCAKRKRTTETNHIKVLNESIQKIEAIDLENVKKVKEFIAIDNNMIIQSLTKIMLDNGKNEKVKFDNEVIKKSVEKRIDIAKKEAECYTNIYEKLRKLMTEIESDNLKLDKYQKVLKSSSIKLNFLDAEKDYIISFLDNERMTAINGEKLHKQMMKEATINFEKDMEQINNLYNLILREIAGKATKKAYKELYNSTYLLDIEETEKNFNQEASSIKSNLGTMINTNYWRIEGIKNIYEVFNKEIEENYERDLTEFMPKEEEEEPQEDEELQEVFGENMEADVKQEDDEEEWFISNDEIEQNTKDDEYYDDEEYDDYEEEDEYDDEEYDDYEEDEYDDEEYDDYEEDEYDDEDENYDDYEDYEEDQYVEEDEIEKKDIRGKQKKTKEDEITKMFALQNEKIKKNLKGQEEREEEKSKGIFGKIFKK